MATRLTPIDPGELNRYVDLLKRPVADAVDSSGAPADEDSTAPWSLLAQRVPAARFDLRGQERLVASQLSSPYDTRWEIHYRDDMDPELLNVPKLRRLRWQNREYDIVAANQIGTRQGVELFTLARA